MNYPTNDEIRDQRWNTDGPVRTYPRRYMEPPKAPEGAKRDPADFVVVSTPAQRARGGQAAAASGRAAPTWTKPGICRNPECGAEFVRKGNSQTLCERIECKGWARKQQTARRAERSAFALPKAERIALRATCPHERMLRHSKGQRICKACGITVKVEFQEAA